MSQIAARLTSFVDIRTWPSAWRNASTTDKLYWILRLGVVVEFYGHGAYGVFQGGRVQWLPYFGVVGISSGLAWKLMPWIGIADCIVATITLFSPRRIVLLYATVWGFWIALVRPLAGQGIWQWAQESVNFGVPFALLYLSGWGTGVRAWVTERVSAFLGPDRAVVLSWILRVTTATLLIGHGGSGAFDHARVWNNYFGVLGLNSATVSALSLINIVGFIEIILGIAVLLKPHRYLLVFVFIWKVFTEFLRIPAGEDALEFIERAASYAAPLALLYLMRWILQTRLPEDAFPTSKV